VEAKSNIRPQFAAQFYPGDCIRQIEGFKKGFTPPTLPADIKGGIVPHAGWFFSGATAAKVFLSIQAQKSPAVFILFGTVHVPGVRKNSIYSTGSWSTPLGKIRVNEDISAMLIDEMPGLLEDNPQAHVYEHSIEVQTPIIKHLFPKTSIVPIAVPPGEDAVLLGEGIGRLIAGKGLDAVVIGSTDLTHYGDNYGFTPVGYGPEAHRWMRENDEKIIRLALDMNAGEILKEAARNYNACGAGAMSAAVAASKAAGSKKGVLIEHITSYDVYPQGEFDMAVGYAGIIF
jgi:hypothetical protein